MDDSIVNAIAARIADKVAERLGRSSELPLVLSPRTLSKLLDCSPSEVRHHLQEKAIPTLKFGNRGYRVSREEFEKRMQRWKSGGDLWD